MRPCRRTDEREGSAYPRLGRADEVEIALGEGSLGVSTTFITRNIWPLLTRTVEGAQQRCAVAVAYFGIGASHLLPLPRGSRLVVDASERAVAAGQTCPAELLKRVKRGDVAIQATNEGNGRVLVSPPGNVLHVRTRREGRQQVSFVYLERVARRRRPIKALARSLGRGALKRLRRGGVVRPAAFAKALLKKWTQ